MNISELKRKFNHKKTISGYDYDQIAHVGTRSKADKIKNDAKRQGYSARVVPHHKKGDFHYDVYVKKADEKQRSWDKRKRQDVQRSKYTIMRDAAIKQGYYRPRHKKGR